MKTIDANTGQELKVGRNYKNIDGMFKVLKIHPGLFSASITIQWSTGRIQVIRMMVRWTHPSYFMQHVAFLPS